jgi:hypothetical protein
MRPINRANALVLSSVAKQEVQAAELLHLADESNSDQQAKSTSCYALWILNLFLSLSGFDVAED